MTRPDITITGPAAEALSRKIAALLSDPRIGPANTGFLQSIARYGRQNGGFTVAQAESVERCEVRERANNERTAGARGKVSSSQRLREKRNREIPI